MSDTPSRESDRIAAPSEPSDAERIAAIRARLDAATPGPWRACTWDPMERPHVHRDMEGQRSCSPPDLPLSKADAEFTAHAPEDIRYLLAWAAKPWVDETHPWPSRDVLDRLARVGAQGAGAPERIATLEAALDDCAASLRSARRVLKDWPSIRDLVDASVERARALLHPQEEET